MNRYTDKPQPDEWIMRGILAALQPLQLDDFDQRDGDFYWDADGKPVDDPTCPVCVGLRIALDCDLARHVDDDIESLHYWDGSSYVSLATNMSSADVDALLHKHGAPADPFGNEAWQQRPFDVLKSAFEEVLGQTIDLQARTTDA